MKTNFTSDDSSIMLGREHQLISATATTTDSSTHTSFWKRSLPSVAIENDTTTTAATKKRKHSHVTTMSFNKITWKTHLLAAVVKDSVLMQPMKTDNHAISAEGSNSDIDDDGASSFSLYNANGNKNTRWIKLYHGNTAHGSSGTITNVGTTVVLDGDGDSITTIKQNTQQPNYDNAIDDGAIEITNVEQTKETQQKQVVIVGTINEELDDTDMEEYYDVESMDTFFCFAS